MQGESDKRNPEYRAYLAELIRQFQSDLHRTDLNVVIGRISDSGLYPEKPLEGKHRLMFEGAKNIRRTQVEFAQSYPHGAWVDTDDLNNKKLGNTMVDDLHYSQEGYKVLGERFAEKAIELIKKSEQKSR
jgi:lysophospholipase L1-like esterase